MLDLRIPSGFFFAITGLIIMALGILFPDDRAPLTPLNVNLYAGGVMLGFGTILLLLARRRA